MLKKISLTSLFIIFAMFSCSKSGDIEIATSNLHTTAIVKTSIPTSTTTPTVYFVNATTFAEATQWAEKFPTSTTPPNYPTPQPPPTRNYPVVKDIAIQSDQPLIAGEYILHIWAHLPFDTNIVTISRINKKQVEIEDAGVWIDKLTGIDLTDDGFPEAVIRTDEGGNGAGSICQYVSIISLAEEPTIILNKEVTCGYKPNNDIPEIVDFFIDLNHDGKTEFISFMPSEDEVCCHFDFSIVFMNVWEYNAKINSFELASSTELSFSKYGEKITEFESLNRE